MKLEYHPLHSQFGIFSVFAALTQLSISLPTDYQPVCGCHHGQLWLSDTWLVNPGAASSGWVQKDMGRVRPWGQVSRFLFSRNSSAFLTPFKMLFILRTYPFIVFKHWNLDMHLRPVSTTACCWEHCKKMIS